MGSCPDAIHRLIERFDRQLDQVRSPDYNQTQLRIDFINPMFAELAWDMDNRQGYAEQYREVVHEDRIKVAGATKAPNYSFRIDRNCTPPFFPSGIDEPMRKGPRHDYDIQPMIAPLAHLLDWSAIQIVATMMPANAFGHNARLEEAIEFVNGPDFAPIDSQRAQLEFNDSLHFRFPTPRPCEFAENNIVHGRHYRCTERWRERPVIVLLTGWNDSGSYKLRFPLIARRYNRAGFNVATLVAPYHFQRRPRQRATFDSGDCLRLAEATAQAIAEIRALTGWLLGEGCPAVALWGFSMGAWHAGIAGCHDERLASVVMCAPCVRANPWVEQRALRPRIRARLPWRRELCEGLNRTVLNMTMIQPVIPRGNILLIEGIYDLMCRKEDLEDLGKEWELPETWRLPYGHVSVCCGGVPGLTGRILRWLAPRLDNPVAQSGSNQRHSLTNL